MRIKTLRLKNFLSFREVELDCGDFVALVGQNAAGKSNAVKALKLLRDIPAYGLQTAIARRGGFDQLRHRSDGRPYNPAIGIDFVLEPGAPVSSYDLRFRSVSGKRYEVAEESAVLYVPERTIEADDKRNESSGFDWVKEEFRLARGKVTLSRDGDRYEPAYLAEGELPAGQSMLQFALPIGGFYLRQALSQIQVLELSPSALGELQAVTSDRDFEPTGANAASIFESLDAAQRREVIDELSAIVPNIEALEVHHFSDQVTLRFGQRQKDSVREFYAKQMSDGTLRAFGIILGLLQRPRPSVAVIEEPETAIHLGALRTMVDILRAHSSETQIVITTHSADIIDTLEFDELRVVWSEDGASRIAVMASHSVEAVRSGLISPGDLLRGNALDPAV